MWPVRHSTWVLRMRSGEDTWSRGRDGTGGLGCVCQVLRWKVPSEYRAHQWLSLAGEFAYEGEGG